MTTGPRVGGSPLTLPHQFDTSDVWRTILKGAFGLTLVITLGLLFELVSGKWVAAIAAGLCDGVSLPGPAGTYPLDRFSAVRVAFSSGPVGPDVQGGPNEVVWLVGRPGTPDIALARTDDGAGRDVGREFGSLLGLTVEEVGAPNVIRLS